MRNLLHCFVILHCNNTTNFFQQMKYRRKKYKTMHIYTYSLFSLLVQVNVICKYVKYTEKNNRLNKKIPALQITYI